MKIVTARQMAELDRRTTVEAGISEKTLIARAGRAAADWIRRRYPARQWRILVLAGKGNNGADGLVAARWLKRSGYSIVVVKIWKTGPGRVFQGAPRPRPGSDRRLLIIDAMFGTGLNRPLTGPFLAWVEWVNTSRAEVVSLDIPSGLHADTGKPLGAAVIARHTLTFGLAKLGLIHEHAADCVGELHLLDIGFPPRIVDEIETACDLIASDELSPLFPRRKRSSHKGTWGRVLVVSGSVGLAGAPVLAARAALRAGAGLVTLVVPRAIYMIAARLAGPEVMVHPLGTSHTGCFERSHAKSLESLLAPAQALVIGPGLGQNAKSRAFAKTLIQSADLPMVLDAGALNLLAGETAILRKARRDVILTPHPGEMARLTGMTTRQVQQDRLGVAARFAREHGVTVVLKGCRTVIAHPPGGDRIRLSINALAGNPGMATGGMGDALAGVIGALLARGLSPTDAARAGVFFHTRAGDLGLPETGGGTASELIERLPQALAELCARA